MRITSVLLADAAQESGGKLYIIGGGWNIITASHAPPPAISQRAIALVVLLSIGWTEANEPIDFEINLVDADERPVIPEPLRGQLTIGRPPQIPKGTDQVMPFVVNFNDLTFEHLGTYAFTFRAGDEELGRVAFHIIANK